jgi:hypothetical protein
MDQHLAQVDVAALADPEEFGLASRGHLLWHQPQPGRQVPAASKRSGVANRGRQRGCVDRANAGNRGQQLCRLVRAGGFGKFLVERGDATVQFPSLGPLVLD